MKLLNRLKNGWQGLNIGLWQPGNGFLFFCPAGNPEDRDFEEIKPGDYEYTEGKNNLYPGIKWWKHDPAEIKPVIIKNFEGPGKEPISWNQMIYGG